MNNIKSKILLLMLMSVINVNAQWKEVDFPSTNAVTQKIAVEDDYIVVTELNTIFRLDRNSDDWKLVDNTIEENSNCNELLSLGDTLLAGYNNDMLISIDRGLSWYNVSDGIFPKKISSMGSNEMYIFALSALSIYRARRGDLVWKEIEFPSNHSGMSINVSGSKLSINQTRSNQIGGGLFLSTDNGDSWEVFFENQNVLESNIFGDTVITQVNNSLFVSTNFGKTWDSREITSEYKHIELINEEIYLFSDVGEIVKYNFGLDKKEIVTTFFDKQFLNSIYYKNGMIYLGTTLGLYTLDPTDYSITTNSPKSTVKILFSIAEYDSKLLISGYNLGVNISNTNGEGWTQFSKALDSIEKSPSNIAIEENLIFGKNYLSNQLFFSEDAISWKPIQNPSNTAVFGLEVWNSNLYFYVNQNLYQSTDYGDNWNILNTLVSDKGYPPTIKSISAEADKLFVGTTEFGVYYSENDGVDWRKTLFAEEISRFSDVTKIFSSGSTLYCLLDHITLGSILFEYNYEINLWNRKADLGKFDIRQVIVLKNSIIWATEQGINITYDNGELVEQINDGLRASDLTYINDLKIYKENLYMVNTNGLYRRPLSDFKITNVESEVEKNYLYSFAPYPLPSESKVNILLYWDTNLPMSIQDISIYDLSGRELVIKDNLRLEKHTNYNGNLVWDCSSVQPGIYIINITHGTEEKSVKVIVE